MAATIPEGSWVFILIMVGIILALLWNDRVSEGSSSSSRSTSSSSDSTSTSTSESKEAPTIEANHDGSQELGESFRIEGEFSKGDATDYNIEAEINGSEVGVEVTDSNSYHTETREVIEGTNTYRAKIRTSYGSNADSGRFNAGEESSTQGPEVRVTEKEVMPERGAFHLKAEGRSQSDADIVDTGFLKVTLHLFEGGNPGRMKDTPYQVMVNTDSPEDGIRNKGKVCEINEDRKPPGYVRFQAFTRDSEGRIHKYEDRLKIPFSKDTAEAARDAYGDSVPDYISVEYGDPDGSDTDDSDDGTSDDPADSGPDPASSSGAQAQIMDITPKNAEEGIDIDDIMVEIFAQAEPSTNLKKMIIEFVWPTGSKYGNNIDLSGKMVRDKKSLSDWLEQSMSLAVPGDYALRVSIVDSAGNKDSDYDTIVINKKSASSTMPSIEDLHDQQDREIEQFHQGIKDLKNLHDHHKEDVELETNLLDEAKDILQKLNDLEDVEEAIRNHLITNLDDTRNMGPRQLKSMSEAELEEMASEAELSNALSEAIAGTNFHNSSGSINTARDLTGYVSDLVMEFEDFQDTLNRERQHQARDNSLIQKLEGEVEEGLSLEKKNANLVQQFLQNAASSTSARE